MHRSVLLAAFFMAASAAFPAMAGNHLFPGNRKQIELRIQMLESQGVLGSPAAGQLLSLSPFNAHYMLRSIERARDQNEILVRARWDVPCPHIPLRDLSDTVFLIEWMHDLTVAASVCRIMREISRIDPDILDQACRMKEPPAGFPLLQRITRDENTTYWMFDILAALKMLSAEKREEFEDIDTPVGLAAALYEYFRRFPYLLRRFLDEMPVFVLSVAAP